MLSIPSANVDGQRYRAMRIEERCHIQPNVAEDVTRKALNGKVNCRKAGKRTVAP